MTKVLQTNETNKRRIASKEECVTDISSGLVKCFKAFRKAQNAYDDEVRQTPPTARARGFEASLLNSKMIQYIQEEFPDKWMFGRYKRFTLRIDGYIILFKKLNRKGVPMNVRTNHAEAISNQQTLFISDESSFYEPILFFGYGRSSSDEITNPRLVYIDEAKVKWIITEDELSKEVRISKEIPLPSVSAPLKSVDEPKLKKNVAKKKASGE